MTKYKNCRLIYYHNMWPLTFSHIYFAIYYFVDVYYRPHAGILIIERRFGSFWPLGTTHCTDWSQIWHGRDFLC